MGVKRLKNKFLRKIWLVNSKDDATQLTNWNNNKVKVCLSITYSLTPLPGFTDSPRKMQKMPI
eukprot:m.321352 g.321352  ORF g.321352 m.321352 type:complete len:63 (+) comp16528_c0_seq8:27-215(+)